MTWNYRIIRHADGHLALHEVYYDEEGKPAGYTEEPITFVADEEESATAVVEALRMALHDAEHTEVLSEADFGKVATSTDAPK